MLEKKKVILMLVVIMLAQIILPMLTVINENCFTIKTTAASEQSASEQKTTVDGITWIYEIENGKAINVKPEVLYVGEVTNVTIPSKLGNYTVTSIGAEAFSWFQSLTTVEIPSEVTSIGDGAFEVCTSLTKIELPEGLTSIGKYAFSNCSNLTTIEIPEGVKSIGDCAFTACDELENIKVAEENKNYSSKDGILFNKNKTSIITYPAGKKEKNYTIPSGVTNVEKLAFFANGTLETIEIPSGVTDIGSQALGYCMSLENIKVAEENKNYSSKDGVLFNKNKTSIIAYPSGKKDKNYAIPSGVTGIEMCAFWGCTSLTSVEIPEGVTNIPKYSLSTDCNNLTIICHEGSYAKEYAISDNIPYIVYGNVNGDDKIEIMDILAINKHRLGKSELTGVYLKAADVNGDGKVDLFDILQINKYRLGKIESL